MIVIRQSCFETNSSSTHSLSIANANEFDRWESDNLFWNELKGKFYTQEEALKQIRENFKKYKIPDLDEYIRDSYDGNINEFLREEEYYSYDNFPGNDYEYDYEEKRFITPSGDEVVAFSYAGYDS